MLDRIKKREAEPGGPIDPAGAIRPRVLACLGPTATGGGRGAEDTARLIRIFVQSELQRRGGTVVVEREALEEILREHELGGSDLADPRARNLLGKFLPAGFLLPGDLLPSNGGCTVLFRITETETSRILGTLHVTIASDADLPAQCSKMAGDILSMIRKAAPWTVPVVRSPGGGRFSAPIGRFHAARTGDRFILARKPAAASPPGSAQPVGTAALRDPGDESTDLDVTWDAGMADTPDAAYFLQEPP